MKAIKQYSNKDSVTWVEYFFIFSILALTGFEYFFRAGVLIIPLAAITGLYFLNKKYKFNDRLILIATPFLLLSLIQTILTYNQNIFSTLILLLLFLSSYFIAEILGVKFVDAFIKILFALSVISIVFFFLTYSVGFMNFINTRVAIYFKPLKFGSSDEQSANSEKAINILIYNFKNYYSGYNRNSGPFWEPGMFAIFINLAFYFNLVLTKRIFSIKNIVFILAIITTFSTTGYIAFIYILFVYFIFYSKSKLSFFFIPILIGVSVYVSSLDFMKAKVLEQMHNSDKNSDNRFEASVIHYKVIEKFPITGVGDGAARYISNFTDASSTANGITFVFVKYGVLLGVFYYLLLFRASVNIMRYYTNSKLMGYSLFFLLLILAFSQDITVRFFYFFIITWGLIVMSPWRTFRQRNFEAK